MKLFARFCVKLDPTPGRREYTSVELSKTDRNEFRGKDTLVRDVFICYLLFANSTAYLTT